MAPTEDTEDCLGRITVGLTRSKSLTLVVSPLDMMGSSVWHRYSLHWPLLCKVFDEESPRVTGPPSIRIQHEKPTAKWKDGPSMRHCRGLAPLAIANNIMTSEVATEREISTYPGESIRL